MPLWPVMEPDSDLAWWRTDPRQAESDWLTTEANDLCDESTDLIDAIDVWKFIEGPNAAPESHDHMTVTFLRDAVGVLGGSAAA